MAENCLPVPENSYSYSSLHSIIQVSVHLTHTQHAADDLQLAICLWKDYENLLKRSGLKAVFFYFRKVWISGHHPLCFHHFSNNEKEKQNLSKIKPINHFNNQLDLLKGNNTITEQCSPNPVLDGFPGLLPLRLKVRWSHRLKVWTLKNIYCWAFLGLWQWLMQISVLRSYSFFFFAVPKKDEMTLKIFIAV